MQFSIVQYNGVLRSSLQISAVQCSSMKCSALQCSAVQYSPSQYSTMCVLMFTDRGEGKAHYALGGVIYYTQAVTWQLAD